MNYGPDVCSTNSNDSVGTEESIGTGHSSKETRSSQDYILMPIWKDGSLFDSSLKNASNDEPQPSSDAEKKDDEDKTLFIKCVKSDILLVQVYVDDIIFGSNKKKLCTEFETLMHKKFQMSSMGELTFFLGLQVTQKDDGIFISQDKYMDKILKKFGFSTVKTASTLMETTKLLLKDAEAEDVDVHLYRSMIGSLMYLTSSRPDIMFVVCACARFQVTPKVLHLHAVKIIFRYLKGQPKLGLWYPKDSPFDLEAYSDSDYAGASLEDRKSTTRELYLLLFVIINIVSIERNYALTVNPTTYTSCIKQFWAIAKAKTVNREVQIQALVDGKKVIVTKTSVRETLLITKGVDGTGLLPNATIFAELEKNRREGKGFFGRVTPLFETMMVQAQEEGEGSEMSAVPQHTSTINQPLSSQPPKKQKPRKTKKQNIEVSQPSDPTQPMADETKNVESVPIHSNDPLLSGEDRLKLNEFLELCTKLSERVLDLENTKTSQAAEITKLKERVKKLERRNKSRTLRHKRLRKGRKIANLDADAKEVKVEKVVSNVEVTIVNATPTTVDELTLAQTLIKIKAAKPKVVTIAATTTTTVVTRPKARGVVVQEPTMMEANYELAQRLQAEEQGELTIEERSKFFVELMDKRKKHFAKLRAEEIRRKSSTKAQIRNQMYAYLKNMANNKHNSFVPMDIEVVKGSKSQEEGSKKRTREELKSNNSKKQKIDENVEDEVDYKAEMKKLMGIVPDDEVAIDAIPLATNSPIIVDWNIIKDGKMGYFQIIRADGSSRRYSTMIRMLQNIDREDLETLWKLVKAKHGNTRLEEAYERVLWGDLKVIFEPYVESEVWRNLQRYNVTVWKLFSSSGVYFERFQNLHIFMLVEKKSPLTPATITKMLNKKLQTDQWNEMCYQLLKLMTK
ncbi:putative ribonuclease H-like domain-containing protein [Tanacetum coccineum]